MALVEKVDTLPAAQAAAARVRGEAAKAIQYAQASMAMMRSAIKQGGGKAAVAAALGAADATEFQQFYARLQKLVQDFGGVTPPDA
ncbi:MAG: hypothetical protein NT049_18885 [Planctomycetota bacterium]|nr:hypothetical protein [Planctomycetota bacterium]